MLGIYKPEVGNSTVGHLRGIREVVKLAGNDSTKIGGLKHLSLENFSSLGSSSNQLFQHIRSSSGIKSSKPSCFLQRV